MSSLRIKNHKPRFSPEPFLHSLPLSGIQNFLMHHESTSNEEIQALVEDIKDLINRDERNYGDVLVAATIVLAEALAAMGKSETLLSCCRDNYVNKSFPVLMGMTIEAAVPLQNSEVVAMDAIETVN